jgi:hypothetical protein
MRSVNGSYPLLGPRHFALDFRILTSRNEPAPFSLDQKERQPAISAGGPPFHFTNFKTTTIPIRAPRAIASAANNKALA